MNSALPGYPLGLGNPRDWGGLDIADQYSRFDRLMGGAEEAALFDSLPDSSEATLTQAFVKRGKTMAERLWLLGYVEAPDKHLARDLFLNDRPGFVGAVARFQAEAGLEADRWTGEETWNALEYLVNFESDLLVPAWKASPETYPAVLRAAQCRLYVLGLAPGLPDKGFTNLNSAGLRRFKLMLLALGIVNRETKDTTSYLNAGTIDSETLTLLMDQDSLMARAAKSVIRGKDGLEFFFVKEAKTLRPHGHEVRKFLTRLVQVELWLLGYEISITRALTCPVRGIDPVNRVTCDPELGRCLMDFGGLVSTQEGDRQGGEITPELFAALVAEEEQSDEAAIHDRIEGRLNTQEAVDQALEEGRRFHLRLWDGIKRVMRWLDRLFKRTGKTLLDVGRLVARCFYQSVHQVFDRVKAALRITAESLAALDGTREVSEGVLISVSFDGDILVGLSPESHGAQTAIRRLKLNAERFCLAARICSMVMSALFNAALARWAALAKALYGQAKACIHLFGTILSLEAELAAMKSS